MSAPVTVPLASMVTSPLADRTPKMPSVPTDTAPGAVWMPLQLTSPKAEVDDVGVRLACHAGDDEAVAAGADDVGLGVGAVDRARVDRGSAALGGG